MRDQLDELVKLWQTQPLVISLTDIPPSGMDLRVAQYEFHKIEDLEEKLSQFPSGTRFDVAKTAENSFMNSHTLDELRTFLGNLGLMVVGEKRDD